MPISINNEEDFDFDDIILDISSSETALGPWSQIRSLVGAWLKLYLQLVVSVRSGILYA